MHRPKLAVIDTWQNNLLFLACTVRRQSLPPFVRLRGHSSYHPFVFLSFLVSVKDVIYIVVV